MEIRAARPNEAGLLSDLALRSKAHWGYDDAFLDACREELTLRPGDVEAQQVTLAESGGDVTGFYALAGDPPEGLVTSFFVDPPAIGTGVGRALLLHCVRVAAGLAMTRLRIEADPHAEDFYRTMGAVRVGEAPSASIEGRSLPLLTLSVPSPPSTDPLYVLLHSPLVGPTTWEPVARVLLDRGEAVAVPSFLGLDHGDDHFWERMRGRVVDAVGQAPRIVLAAHSGAAVLVPSVFETLSDRVAANVFVDAGLPGDHDATPVAEDEFRAFLEARAVDGRLAPWSTWWGDTALEAMLPEPDLRARIAAECPELPLDYFDRAAPTPPGWHRAPCAYVHFSSVYDRFAAEAERRGWPVERIAGGHLHLAVDPAAVAGAITRLSRVRSPDTAR